MLLPVEGEQDCVAELTTKIQVSGFFGVFILFSNLESISCRQIHLHVIDANTKMLYMCIMCDKLRILLLLKNNQSFQ